MSNDVSSKVYLFLAKQGDWATAADKNGDGTVIKSEFRQYMENNYEWNGEDASAKSDLINQFWKEIDTKQSGKLNKKLNNKGALDKNEINTMNNKIQMYEILNNFTSNSIEVPSVVQDRTNWKKSVAESLANKVDAYISSNKSADNLEAYLQEISPEIERKATADYCANQYLNTEMKDIVKEYGYSYADDSTLQGMIDNYISQLSANSGEIPSAEEINETVINIINEYLSTAALKDSDGFDLSQFGYTANDNSPLNDLQKSIIKSNLQKNLQDISKESDYETYKSLYDDAVNQFIESKLADGKFADFATLQNYGIAEFENSDNYKSVKKAISVKAYIDSADFKSAISSAVSSAFADRISNVMTGEVPAYDTLISDIMSKAQNGEFDNADGSLNTEKMQKYIIEQVKSNIAEFYPNGLGDMSLDDLNTMYDALVEAAREKNDAAKVKEAAISYCQAVSKKSTTLAQAVKDVFGAGYAATINQMLSGEIDSKMTELKAKVNEIGDIAQIKTSGSAETLWNGINDTYSVTTSSTASIQLNRTFNYNGNTITSDRITYSSNNSCVSIDASTGAATVKSSVAGTYQAKIVAMVDGEEVTSKIITIKVQDSNENIVAKATDTRLALNSRVDNWNGEESFKDLYNNDKNVILYGKMDSRKKDWDHMKNDIKNNLTNLGQDVVSTLATAGLDKSKLTTAMNTVVNRYVQAGAIRNKNNSGTSKDALKNHCNEYMADNRTGTQSRIVWTVDTDGKDSNVYMIHFKDFVDDIINEYNKLAA